MKRKLNAPARLVAAVLLIASVVAAQPAANEAADPDEPQLLIEPSDGESGDADPGSDATRTEPVIAPRGPVVTPREAVIAPAYGTTIVDRRATVSVDDDGWPVCRLQGKLPEHVLRDLRLLPTPWREAMEAVLEREADAVFSISGEIAFHDERCYLLPSRVVRILPARKAGGDGAAGPGAPPAEDGDPDAADAGDVMGELLAGDETEVLQPPASAGGEEPGESVAPLAPPASPRRSIVSNRRVHLVPEPDDDFWWQARFVSDNTLREQPLRLLPNRILDRSQKKISDSSAFVVSGEVHSYRGRRYLLLRKALPRRDLGL